MQFHEIKSLPDIKQQVTQEKEPDFLRLVINDEYPEGVVVQLEFETSDYPKMDKRMLDYIGILHKNTNKPVLQYVLFLGEGKAEMNNQLNFGNLKFFFPVINIEDFHYSEFMNSTHPEEVILALLGNHEELTDDEILELILSRLVELKGDTIEIGKFTQQLIMLSRLRNLQNKTNKKVSQMQTSSFNIETDFAYIAGIERGENRGEVKQAISAIQKMTKRKVDSQLIAEFLGKEISFVKEIQKQFLLKSKIVSALKKKNNDFKDIAKKLKVNPLLVELVHEELTKPPVKGDTKKG